MCSMLACFVSLGTVLIAMVDLSNGSNGSVDHQLLGFVNTTLIPGISNSSMTTESPANLSTTPAHVHANVNASHGNDSFKTATTASTVINPTITVSKLPEFSLNHTTHHNKHQQSSKIDMNSTTELPEVTTVKITIPTTKESVIGSHWDGWKRLLTKSYWKKRFDDKYYLMELLIPTAAGIILCLMLVMIYGLLQCIILLSRYKRKRRSRMEYHSGEKLTDNTWMLLGNSDSEEEAL